MKFTVVSFILKLQIFCVSVHVINGYKTTDIETNNEIYKMKSKINAFDFENKKLDPLTSQTLQETTPHLV